MTMRFTGWHMAAILLGFFGLVVAVNLYMAHTAISTFGGTVVENSYVASQKFNGWLAAARRQDRLGWSARVSLTADRHVHVEATKAGAALADLAGSGLASHPLGATAPIALAFSQSPDGSLTSLEALPQGRWLVHVSLRHRGDGAKLSTALQ